MADRKRIEERRQNALQLRMAGATLQDIVNAGIGYKDTGNLSRELDKALEGFYMEDIEKLLILDLARIDEMQKYCTVALRQGDTSQARNIMALMQFRRETLGITPELLQDKRNEASRIVNNGIMVVQGTTRDYLASMMEASGASPEEIQNELRELEKATSGKPEIPQGTTPANNAGAHAQTQARVTSPLGDISRGSAGGSQKVIQGEIVPDTDTEDTDTEDTGTETTKQTGANKRVIKVKAQARKNKGDGITLKTRTTPGKQDNRAARSTRYIPSDGLVSLSQRVEEAAAHMDHVQDIKTTPRLGSLSDPAVIPAGEEVLGSKILSVPIKLRDNNQPVSPGVVYRKAPRKPSHEEASMEVTRRLKKPATVDRIRTRVHEEPI